jgi:hypothetical protein
MDNQTWLGRCHLDWSYFLLHVSYRKCDPYLTLFLQYLRLAAVALAAAPEADILQKKGHVKQMKP